MLSSKQVVKLLVKDDKTAASSTNSKKDTPEEAAIRKAMCNQMVINVKIFRCFQSSYSNNSFDIPYIKYNMAYDN